MNINNEVKLGSEVVGFRCFQCGDVFGSMWGSTCNSCRKKNEYQEKQLQILDKIANNIKKD